MRSHPKNWISLMTKLGCRQKKRRSPPTVNYGRKLRIEQLEDRRMLAPITVNHLGNFIDPDPDVTTLREAINAANQDDIEDDIIFSTDPVHNLDGGTIFLDANLPLITEPVHIDASMLNKLTIDGMGARRVFNIRLSPQSGEEQTVTLEDLTIQNGSTSGDGGGVNFTLGNSTTTNATAELQIINSTIKDSFAGGDGGGVSFDTFTSNDGISKLTMVDSTISGNTTSTGFGSSGGGVFVSIDREADAPTEPGVVIQGTEIYDNLSGSASSSGGGGGVSIEGEGFSTLISDSTITNNVSNSGGGGLFIDVVSHSLTDLVVVEILDSTISGNDSTLEGGGLLAYLNEGNTLGGKTAELTIERSTITGNNALDAIANYGNGGGFAIKAYDSLVNITDDNVISGNKAFGKGGGGYTRLFRSYVDIANATISNNHSYGTTRVASNTNPIHDGGAGLYLRIGEGPNDAGSGVTITASTISGNTAEIDGGGVFALMFGDDDPDADTVEFTIQDSTISGNTSNTLTGGGLYICEKHGATFDMINTTVSGNFALDASDGKGGGIALARSEGIDISFEAAIRHSTITNNYSPDGGGVYSEDIGNLKTTLDHTIVSGNYDTDDTQTQTANNIAGVIDEVMSRYNLWGPGGGATLPTGNGNRVDSDNVPDLFPLSAHNGGTTAVHMPMSGSEAIDNGDPTLDAGVGGVPQYDQRGTPFTRVYDPANDSNPDPTIDIGAVEFGVGALRITDIVISSSISQHEPYSFTQATYDNPLTPAIEYEQVIGTGKQLYSIPVGLADTITVHFDEPVTNVSQNSLTLIGLRTGNVPTLASGGFSYTSGETQASWRFEGWTLEDHYLITVDDAITDLFSNRLDGDWTNPERTTTVNTDISEFPSGDGVAGGDFNFVATILPGDVNLNGIIDGVDAGIMFANWDPNAIDKLFTMGDVDGDGDIDAEDAGEMFENWALNLQIIVIAGDINGNDDDVDVFDWQAYYANPSNYDLNGDGNFGDSVDDALMDAQFGHMIVIVMVA